MIKSDVASPVIGWDFVCKYKLDLVWDQDEIIVIDKKAKIKKKLDIKPISFEQSQSFSSPRLIQKGQGDQVHPCRRNRWLLHEINAMEAIGTFFESAEVKESREDINIIKEE